MVTPQELIDLMQRVSARDQQAFSALYQATNAKLYGIILRILQRRDLSAEVLQEVYVKIWSKAEDYDPRVGSPISWMAAIARNRALDEVRKKHVESIEDHPEVGDIASDDASGLDMILKSEDGKRLADCLLGIEPEKRHMVIAAYCNGASREELAQQYGQPVNTVKTWLRRSLAQLRTCMGS